MAVYEQYDETNANEAVQPGARLNDFDTAHTINLEVRQNSTMVGSICESFTTARHAYLQLLKCNSMGLFRR